MKIGILTYHYGCNFGGVLQAYALQRTLQNMGYDDVIIINCISNRFKYFLRVFPRKLSLEGLKALYIKLRWGGSCKKSFDDFRASHMTVTKKVSRNNIASVANGFDTIIVGSDQIWNIGEQKNGLYFFDWFPEFKGKRIAYAPCCGKNIIAELNRSKIKEALSKFDALSARNDETCSFVEDVIGIRPQKMPDPTCLYDFREFLSSSRMIHDNYIFTYILGKDIEGGNNSAINILREKYPGRKVIASVIAHSNPLDVSWADKIMYDLSPIEWLNLIQYADIVFTDSYHGAIFSMKFQVPFFAYYSEISRKARFVELEKQFDISDNIVNSLAEIVRVNPQKRDFGEVFCSMRGVGISYLEESLK